MAQRGTNARVRSGGGDLSLETKPRHTADALRNTMDAAKHLAELAKTDLAVCGLDAKIAQRSW